MVCLFCGKKLTVVKKLSSDEFCSPAHKQAFLQQHEKLALARLLESQGRLGGGPRRNKVDLAEVAAAGRNQGRALNSQDPDFGDFLVQQIGIRRHSGLMRQRLQECRMDLVPAIPSSKSQIAKPAARAGLLETELVNDPPFDADVASCLQSLSEARAAHEPDIFAAGTAWPPADPGFPFVGACESCVCPQWPSEFAETDAESLLPQLWFADWTPASGTALCPTQDLRLSFPRPQLEVVAYNAGPTEAEIDSLEELPLAGPFSEGGEYPAPDHKTLPAASRVLESNGFEGFPLPPLPVSGAEGATASLDIADGSLQEGRKQQLPLIELADAQASQIPLASRPFPAQLPFSAPRGVSFQYDRKLHRLRFSFRLPIPDFEPVLPSLRPNPPLRALLPLIRPFVDVTSKLKPQRQSTFGPEQLDARCLPLENPTCLGALSLAPLLRVPGDFIQALAAGTSSEVPAIRRKNAGLIDLRGPRAGRPVPIPILLRATPPAPSFKMQPPCPFGTTKQFPVLRCPMIPATVDLAPFSAMSQLAGGNVDMSLSRLKQHWKEAPSDLRWIALAVPLVLGLIWFSLTPGAQRFSRDASREAVRDSGRDASSNAFRPASASSSNSALAASESNPAPAPKAAGGFLEKFLPGDSMSGIKVGIKRRAAVELGDDFRQGLADWSGEGDWASGWRYDPAGFVRPRKLALYTPTLELEDYRFEFLGQIESKALSWVFRAADSKNYLVAKLLITKPGPLPQVELVRYAVHNGKAGPRKSVPLPMQVYMDEIYRVRVDVSGQDYVTTIKGIVIDVFSDPTIARGGVGFFAEPGEESRLRWVEVSHQYDFLGRLCAFLVPYNVPNSNVRITQ